mgnify:CR=1 FL=1
MKTLNVQDLDFSKGKGLIPVVVQDFKSREVLTLAYTDREALEKTLETGYAHYWRRSHGRVMMKGETSGSVQRVRDILVDCDYDALVYLVEPKGNACHTGEKTCFHNKLAEANRLGKR